ncbi:retrovirus-related pol polyprotein from transposon TNT 1-94 [Tanacetum coccineum]
MGSNCPVLHLLLIFMQIVQITQFNIDSECTKHVTGNLKLLTNFVEKFLGSARFENDQFSPIIGYEDLVQGNVMIKRVYYVEDLQGNELLTGTRGSDLYTITLHGSSSPNPIFFMAKASTTQAWLWHRRLSHLNFDTINLLSKNDIVNDLPKLKYVKYHLCSSCELGKAKRSNFKTKTAPSSKGRLDLLHMDLCRPMRVESIKVKKYILVIVDYYSRYTWIHFLRSKDETSETSVHNSTKFGIQDHNDEHSSSKLVPEVVSQAELTDTSSLQELKLLSSPMYDEYFNGGNQGVSKSSAISDLQQQDTSHTLNVQHISKPSTPSTNVNAENNDNNQAVNAQFDEEEFINPFCTPVHEVAESSSHNVDPSNMHTFYQRHRSDYHRMKDHPLEQVRGNPSKPVQTRRQLATDP